MKRRLFSILAGLSTLGTAHGGDFSVTSAQLVTGARFPDAQVFSGFGCTGGNISPALKWEKPPSGTKSFAVTLYDPDAPTGSGWWHWVMFNIPAHVSGLDENAGNPAAALAPSGSVQSRTDFGIPGYGGPCPPKGDAPHRYRLTVYALNTGRLPLDTNASGAMVGYYLRQTAIEEAVIEVEYGRPTGSGDPADEGARDVIAEFGGSREGEC